MTLQRPMFPPVDPTRRRFLSQAAAATAGGGVLAMTGIAPAISAPVPSSEAAGPSPGSADPIFEAIEAHKTTCATLHVELNQHIALERIGIKGRVSAAHDGELAECEARMDTAFDVQTYAACALVNVKPTTGPGVMALLQYAIDADTDGEMWPDLLPDQTSKRALPWHRFLIETLVDVLPEMAVQS